MRERMLKPTGERTKREQSWMKRTHRLISIMPPLPPPPRNLQGVISYPSMSTLSSQGAPNLPSTLMLSTTFQPPNPDDLIHQIFPSGQLPTPNSVSWCQRVMKPPFVATLMVPLSDPMKSEDVIKSPATFSHRTSHLDSSGTKDATSSHSPSPTMMGSPNTLI